MTELEYEKEFSIVSTEVDHAFEAFVILEEINRLAIDDAVVHAILTKNGLFWSTQVRCLQTTLFIGMARIFDSAPNAHSIHNLVNATLAHSQFFSKDSLHNRRLKAANGIKPEWLDDLVHGAWMPQDASELRYLKKALAPYAKVYRDVYHPIRNNFYGHRLGRVEETLQLFERTDRAQIGGILDFLRELISLIYDLYHNGCKRDFSGNGFDRDKNEIRKEVQHILSFRPPN